MGELDRQRRAQRRKLVEDGRRLECAVRALPERALSAVASPAGLLVSFSLGAATAGAAGPRGPFAGLLRDVITQAALAELPALGDLIRTLTRRRSNPAL
jgi:hypothetical protein